MDTEVDRKALLAALVRYELPVEPVLNRLASVPWDSTEELARIGAADIVSILDRFIDGELSAEQVTEWADLLEVRDDVGVDPHHENALRDIIFRLANPNLRDAITPAMASRIRIEILGLDGMSNREDR
jgi:hypothetical protein